LNALKKFKNNFGNINVKPKRDQIVPEYESVT